MRAVIVGTSGHYEYAFDAKQCGVQVLAVSPADKSENIDACIKKFTELGHSVVHVEDYTKLLDLKPDIAIINSVFSRNCELSIYFLEHGVSVFCEKPCASSIDELSKLEKSYRESKEKYGTCYAGMFGLSYEDWAETVRELVSSGAIGKVRMAEAQKSYKLGNREPFYSSRDTYPGTIAWTSIHGIDWLYGICGLRFDGVFSVHSSRENSGNGTMEMIASSLFYSEDGIIGTVTSDYYRPSSAKTHGDDRLRVVGTKGIIESIGKKVCIIDSQGEREIETRAPKMSIFAEFVSDIQGKGQCRRGAEYSFEVTRVALLARDSADNKKEVRF